MSGRCLLFALCTRAMSLVTCQVPNVCESHGQVTGFPFAQESCVSFPASLLGSTGIGQFIYLPVAFCLAMGWYSVVASKSVRYSSSDKNHHYLVSVLLFSSILISLIALHHDTYWSTFTGYMLALCVATFMLSTRVRSLLAVPPAGLFKCVSHSLVTGCSAVCQNCRGQLAGHGCAGVVDSDCPFVTTPNANILISAAAAVAAAGAVYTISNVIPASWHPFCPRSVLASIQSLNKASRNIQPCGQPDSV